MPKTLLTLSRIAAVSALRSDNKNPQVLRSTTDIIAPVVGPTGPVILASSEKSDIEPTTGAQPHEPEIKPAPTCCRAQKLENRFRVKTVLTANDQEGSAGQVSVSIHSECEENAVDTLLKLITEPSPYNEQADSIFANASEPAATVPAEPLATYKSSRQRIPALAGNRRAIYELEQNETLSDVARKFYDETAVAGLIYKLNWTKIHTQFEPGLVLRVRMVEGMVLLLPTAAEAHNYVSDLESATRRRTFEYDIV